MPNELTDKQREVLKLALDMGMYQVPRKASVGDIASKLDVSSQAVSERLRRATGKVVSKHLQSGGDYCEIELLPKVRN